MTNYILRIKHKSKYLGFKRKEYIEFETFESIMTYIDIKKLKSCEFDIYANVIL